MAGRGGEGDYRTVAVRVDGGEAGRGDLPARCPGHLQIAGFTWKPLTSITWVHSARKPVWVTLWSLWKVTVRLLPVLLISVGRTDPQYFPTSVRPSLLTWV